MKNLKKLFTLILIGVLSLSATTYVKAEEYEETTIAENDDDTYSDEDYDNEEYSEDSYSDNDVEDKNKKAIEEL